MSDDELMEVTDGEQTDVQEKDMMSMFASVWVKVEVQEDPDADVSFNHNSTKGEASERALRVRRNTAMPMHQFNDENVMKPRRRNKKSTKILYCDQCDYTTVYKNCLELHILGHTNSKPHSCQFCDYTTKYPTSLNRHILIKHQSKELLPEDKKTLLSYHCDQCDYSSYFKWNLNAHKRKHKLEKQFKCPQCTYSTAYRHNFIKHSKVHAEGVFFKCDKCPFVTRFEGHITRHLAKIHNEVTEKAYKCDFCDFSTKVRWRLNIHKQRSKQENPMKCAFCEFETSYMCESKKHKVTHYNKIYGPGLNQKLEMSLPKSILEAEPPMPEYPIQESGDEKKGSNHQYMVDPDCLDWNSIQVLESDDKERPFLCHMCTYTSKFKAAVQRHFQRHHTGSHNRPYKCCNCDFSTKTKDQIALHNKRSKSEKPLFCKTCGFTTNFKCQYVMHQKCHYAYKCTACSYSCRQKYELQKHYTTLHLGNGLKCSYCDYKAARKESLLCHETIHTGIKPYKCSICPYMSVRRSLLDNHMKRYHSDLKKDITIVSDSKIESLKVSLSMLQGGLVDNCEKIGELDNGEDKCI